MKTQNTNFLATLEKNDICNLAKEVKETIATDTQIAGHNTIFTAADYWNLQRSRKIRTGRRYLAA